MSTGWSAARAEGSLTNSAVVAGRAFGACCEGPKGVVWVTPRPDILECMADRIRWEYATAPLLIHATQQILNNWGADGWELVQVVPGPNPEQLVAYFKRPA